MPPLIFWEANAKRPLYIQRCKDAETWLGKYSREKTGKEPGKAGRTIRNCKSDLERVSQIATQFKEILPKILGSLLTRVSQQKGPLPGISGAGMLGLNAVYRKRGLRVNLEHSSWAWVFHTPIAKSLPGTALWLSYLPNIKFWEWPGTCLCSTFFCLSSWSKEIFSSKQCQ